MKREERTLIFSFLALPVAIYALFVLVPYGAAMVVAFTRWRALSANITFNGLNNFIKLYRDEQFWQALSHNGIALIVLPAATLALALFFAFLFTQGIRMARLFRIIFFFPQVLSAVVVAVLWGFIYHPTVGLLNAFFELIGIDALANFTWLGDPKTVFGSILVVVIWQSVGFYMVLFVSGMEGIPNEYYEAARLDGAAGWTLFANITVPLLWETIRTALVFVAIGAMDLFAIVTVMTNGTGGPSQAADVVPVLLYRTAFTNGEFGYAAAIGVALLLIILGLSFLSLRVTQRETIQY
ncbi:MAG: sugar ABC transporter permease [Caldilineaceae bacterium]